MQYGPSVRLTLVLVGILGGAGCASFSSVQTADTLGRGRIQGAVEPGLWGAVTPRGPDLVPHVDAAVRVGVADRVDLGVRAGSSFFELQGKFLLTDPQHPALAVSLAPSLGGIIARSGIVNLGLPVLVGFKLGAGHQFVLGPRGQAFFVYDGARWLTVLGVGTSVGFMWRIADAFGLMPEVAAVVPVFGGSAASLVFSGLNAAGLFVQFKLGFLFGRFSALDGLTPQPPASAQPALPKR